MASTREFVDYVVEQAALGERLSFKRMFGEYALYVDSRVVVFICDDSVFLKRSAASTALIPSAPERPPYPGAKDYPVIDEWLDDGVFIQQLLVATAALMPLPAPKKAKKKPKI